MNAAWASTVWANPAGARAWPKPGASQATARRRAPMAAISGSQSALDPGLPCTNTTASSAPAGPASRSGVVISPTRSSLWRTAATGSVTAGRARAAQHAQRGRRAQHVPRRLAHAHDGDEGAGHRGVVLGDRAQAAQVGVDHPHAAAGVGRGRRGARGRPRSPGARRDRRRAERRRRSAGRGRAPRARGSRAGRSPRRRRQSSPARRSG